MWPKVFSVVVLKLSNQLHSCKKILLSLQGIGANEKFLRRRLIRAGWRANSNLEKFLGKLLGYIYASRLIGMVKP